VFPEPEERCPPCSVPSRAVPEPSAPLASYPCVGLYPRPNARTRMTGQKCDEPAAEIRLGCRGGVMVVATLDYIDVDKQEQIERPPSHHGTTGFPFTLDHFAHLGPIPIPSQKKESRS